MMRQPKPCLRRVFSRTSCRRAIGRNTKAVCASRTTHSTSSWSLDGNLAVHDLPSWSSCPAFMHGATKRTQRRGAAPPKGASTT